MPGLFVSFASLLFAVALLMGSSGLLGSLISLRAVAEGFELQFAGLLMSGFYGGMILGTLRCGQLIDRVGHIRAFATFCAVNAMVVLTLPLVISPWVWLALRVVIGFNMAGLYMVIESWLNSRADSRTRGSLMALYMIISYLAMGGGQLLLDIYPIMTSEPFMLAALLITAALIPVSITRSVHPSPIETDHLSFRRLFAISPLGLLATSGAGLLSGAVWGLAPIFARRLGLENDGIALFMGVLVTSGLLLQWPLGKLSDRVDRRMVIAGVAIATALVSAAMVPVTLYYSFGTLDPSGIEQRMLWLADPLWLLLLAGLFGGLHATLYPLSVAQTNDQAGPGRAVAVSAGLVLAYGSGAIFGPIGAGALMDWIGAIGLFIFTGVIACGIAVLALIRSHFGETLAEEDKEQFVVMPEVSTSPAPGEIDPRTDDEIASSAA